MHAKVEGDEVVLRCQFCGDSDDQRHAHMHVNVRSGLYHCYRCGAGGKLPAKIHLSLLSKLGTLSLGKWTEDSLKHADDDNPWEELELFDGPGNPRKSALKRHHYEDPDTGILWDAFKRWSYSTMKPTGVHLRYRQTRHSEGFGFAWSHAPSTLTSNAEHPLRLVEGPYDVLADRDVCLFGFFSRGRCFDPLFRGQYVILCPDGDVWQKPGLMQRFSHLLRSLLDNASGVYVVGVELLSGGADPDEVPVKERVLVPHDELRVFLKALQKGMVR